MATFENVNPIIAIHWQTSDLLSFNNSSKGHLANFVGITPHFWLFTAHPALQHSILNHSVPFIRGGRGMFAIGASSPPTGIFRPVPLALSYVNIFEAA